MSMAHAGGGSFAPNFVLQLVVLIQNFLLFGICIHLHRRITDVQVNIDSLFEYRVKNEVQLENLIKDINKNDNFLNDKLTA